jgi:hypothetical protein
VVDAKGGRLVTFGHIAGRMGVAAGVLAWCRQVRKQKITAVCFPHWLLFEK